MTSNPAMNGLVNAIARALEGLRFGSVEITVHDGRVTLIERREKLRVTDDDALKGTGTSIGSAAPIGRPKDARARELNRLEEDPTGRPEVPQTERADDATRNLEGTSCSVLDDDDDGDGNGRPGRDRRRPGAAPASSRGGGSGA